MFLKKLFLGGRNKLTVEINITSKFRNLEKNALQLCYGKRMILFSFQCQNC